MEKLTKKLAQTVALALISASAHASTYVDGKKGVLVPHGCHSWSCIAVSLPGYYSHNVQTAHARSAR